MEVVVTVTVVAYRRLVTVTVELEELEEELLDVVRLEEVLELEEIEDDEEDELLDVVVVWVLVVVVEERPSKIAYPVPTPIRIRTTARATPVFAFNGPWVHSQTLKWMA